MAPRATAKTKKSKKKDAVSALLTCPKSPLAVADLRAILSHPMAWDSLSSEEQAEMLALFPDGKHIIEADGRRRPNFDSLLSDDSFRKGCADFAANISDGRHDDAWLEDAWKAHVRRKRGSFDHHLDATFEKEWNVRLPVDLKARRS
ncbi:hypothetical protein DCS_02786 [Drechmeria coniospora]|uniref:DEUBAD domain-containing protein n=1 Tax=Drechmeria coniospora TaxID=98403 RepID=A0A151GX71_DRECN|nr:hypothetical protein DCS_02786 [Drechmeria coniospora]KYK61643.1 hypothetical protein DCS_02786 [Drechmeria coniospora]